MGIFKRLQNPTLNVKVTFLLIVAFVILLIGITVVLVANIRTLTDQVSRVRTQQEAALIQTQFEDFSQSLLNSARVIVGTSNVGEAVVSGNTDGLRTTLLVKSGDTSVDQVQIYDSKGKQLLKLLNNPAIADQLIPERLISLGLIGVEVTELVPEPEEANDPERGLLAVAVTPIKNAAGEVVGVAVVEKELTDKVLDQINFGRKDIHLSLLYRDQIVARTVDELIDVRSLPYPSGIQQSLNGEISISPDYMQMADGFQDSLAYVPLKIGRNREAIAILHIEVDTLFVFQRDIIRSTVLIFSILALATVLFIIVFMRISIVQRIRQLTSATQFMSRGDYSHRAQVGSGDEIGQLAGAFNGMADQIKGLIDSLEQRVRETQSARERAERADQVKSAFLASMSHELRTPLNAIINFTQFVIEGDVGMVNAEQSELLGDVVGSAKHLLNLINDVLDMSKIEAGSLTLFVEDDIQLSAILDNVVTLGRGLLINKPIELRTEIEPNLPVIRGDRQRILQILLNLMSNACKYTPQGEIKVTAHQSNDEIVVAVADTGPGIATQDQAIVFEAFKQTRTGLRQSGGTGLGMPIAKKLAEAHGGRLWLESETGKGTTFYVVLPTKSAELVPTLA